MYTEDEAKTKWCPFARTSYSTVEEIEDGGVNRAQGPSEVSCIASACMAWRRAQKRNPSWKPHSHMMSMTEEHPADKQPWYIEDETRGYCGLAGKP